MRKRLATTELMHIFLVVAITLAATMFATTALAEPEAPSDDAFAADLETADLVIETEENDSLQDMADAVPEVVGPSAGIDAGGEADLAEGVEEPLVYAYAQYNYYNSANDYQIACTWYAEKQVREKQGIALPTNWGHAGSWFSNAKSAGYSTGSTPRVGAIACWSTKNSPPYGHVAYVTGVNSSSSFNLIEGGSAWKGNVHGVCSRTVNSGPYWPDLGFIYLQPVSISVKFSKWEDGRYTFIEKTNAAIGQQIDVTGATPSDSGMVLYDNNRRELARKNNGGWDSRYNRVYFNIGSELKYTLAENTTYQYRFFAVVNGQTYWSAYQSFATPPTLGAAMTSGYDRVLPDGDYAIVLTSTLNSKPFYFLDIAGTDRPAANGTNVCIFGDSSTPTALAEVDLWTIAYSNGFYTIKQKGTNMALDVSGASLARGTNVQVWNSGQKWAIVRDGEGYRVLAQCNGFALDNVAGTIASSNNVRMWSANGTAAQRWSFIPVIKDLSQATIKTEYGGYGYTAGPKTPNATVTLNGVKLVEGRDYTLSYSNNLNVGYATVTATGKGSYTGTTSTTFYVFSFSFFEEDHFDSDYHEVVISRVADQAYTGKALTPKPTIRFGAHKAFQSGSETMVLKQGTDYTLAYKNNKNVGTATIIATGKGNFSDDRSVTFKIVPAAISKAAASKIADQAYTGSAIKPKPTLTFNGLTLKEGTDYTLSYKSNTKIGTATITVTGKGNFTGTKSVTFKIVDKPVEEMLEVWRLYNRKTSEHLYTVNKSEYDQLPVITKGDWVQEGIGWIAPKTSKTPVYRLYNKRSGDHHYTTSKAEADALCAKHGWTSEGIAFYSDDARRLPLYRVYNPRLKRGQHHYTAAAQERNALTSKHGWKDEGIGFYGITCGQKG